MIIFCEIAVVKSPDSIDAYRAIDLHRRGI